MWRPNELVQTYPYRFFIPIRVGLAGKNLRFEVKSGEEIFLRHAPQFFPNIHCFKILLASPRFEPTPAASAVPLLPFLRLSCTIKSNGVEIELDSRY